MTASVSGSEAKLPLWRLIAGISVLGILVLLLVLAVIVYVDNYRLDRYMDALAARPESAALSDFVLKDSIVQRARQLDLPVSVADITVTRAAGVPHIKIARYGVQTYLFRMDLRLSEAASH